MTSKGRTVSRRDFAKGLALAPFGIMATTSEFGHSEEVSQDAKPTVASHQDLPSVKPKKKKTAAEYNRHPQIQEADPFAEPFIFERSDVRPRVRPFALHEVLLDPGPLQQARDWNRGYMLRLGNDRLLHNFRVNAGLPSTARPLGGWEAPDCELRGHFVGHYLSASAMLYAGTQDSTIKTKADELVAGIADCQARLNDNGYVSAFPAEYFVRLDQRARVWAPFYTLHKIMAGLLDMNTYGNNRQALEVLVRLAGWVDHWTASKTEEHMQDILNTEFGGMNEVLYNLAVVTREDSWARTGDRFTKKVFFTPLAVRCDELKGLHANTHIPQVIGAARRYEISSDYRFANVGRFFFETVSDARTYVTGGSGNTESWLTQPGHLSLELRASSHHQECCCAYNMMKLTRHLFSWSGEARFIDYYERNLLNHRLGAIEPQTGLSTYFLSMSPGAWKTTCTEDETFWCCTGTALEDFAKLNDSIYYHDDHSLFVNLYVNSVVHWTAHGIRMRQTTKFPESDRTLLTVESSPATPWTLRLRIPAWTTSDCAVTINGKPLQVSGSPGSYLTVKRLWRAGDRVELSMPMRITSECLPDDPTQQAFLYGPLVLAGQFAKENIDEALEHNQGPEIQEAPEVKVPAIKKNGSDPSEWIHPIRNQPLTFRTTGQIEDVTLKPLNQSWERFTVYWSVS